MQVKLNTRLGAWIAENHANAGGRIIGAALDEFNKVHAIMDDWSAYGGKWYVFRQHCGETALICASSFCEAYDDYLEAYCHDESEGATDEDFDYGTFTDSGKFISEAQSSYVFGDNASSFPDLVIELALDEDA